MNAAYRNFIANAGGTEISHIALFDDTGTELTGGDPAYARQAVTWTSADDGSISPTADLEFNVPGGATVAEWRGFSALTGGTDYEGASLTNEAFADQGTYTLLAAQTAINHNSA